MSDDRQLSLFGAEPAVETGPAPVAAPADVDQGAREFAVDRGAGPEPMVAVYVPTNHLYLGDVIMCARADALFPELSVEQGIRIFLTGGMGIPPHVNVRVGRTREPNV